MHPSTNIYDLKENINAHGHTITNVWNIKQRGKTSGG